MYVYFIQGQVTRLVKIGYTANCLYDRLNTIQSNSPDKLTLLKTVKGDRKLEQLLHKQFESVRSHGEWFYPSLGLMKYIKTLKGAKPRKRKKVVDIEAQIRKERLINHAQKMWEQGFSKGKIAKELGVTTISQYLPKGHNPNRKKVSKTDACIRREQRTKDAKEMYLNGEPLKEIASKLKIHYRTVRKYLKNT